MHNIQRENNFYKNNFYWLKFLGQCILLIFLLGERALIIFEKAFIMFYWLIEEALGHCLSGLMVELALSRKTVMVIHIYSNVR